MKRKLLSIMLSIAVALSFMPMFTLQANAASSGGKNLVKTKTVIIKPGQTYKSPKFKLRKKMCVQVPLTITLPGKVKDSDYDFMLSYTLSLKTKKGKTKFTYKCPRQGIYNVYTDELKYDNWVYGYNKLKKPGFKKGKYYITIKNTSKRPIRVKYSVYGYKKIAAAAKLKKSIEMDDDQISAYVGTVGPGLPITKSITSSNKALRVDWTMSRDGKLRLYPDPTDWDTHTTIVTVTLKNNKKYKIKLKVYGAPGD